VFILLQLYIKTVASISFSTSLCRVSFDSKQRFMETDIIASMEYQNIAHSPCFYESFSSLVYFWYPCGVLSTCDPSCLCFSLYAGVVPRTMWIALGGSIFLGVYDAAQLLLQMLLPRWHISIEIFTTLFPEKKKIFESWKTLEVGLCKSWKKALECLCKPCVQVPRTLWLIILCKYFCTLWIVCH